jgi:hypothetical protein
MNLQKFLGRLAKAIPQKKRHLKTNFLTFAQILLISWSDGRGILKMSQFRRLLFRFGAS